MYAKRVGAAFLFCAAAAVALPAAAADEPYGVFDGPGFDAAHVTQWRLFKGKDGVTVQVTIKDPKDPAAKKSPPILGLGNGRDVKVTDGVVEFTLEWSRSHKVAGPKDAKYVAEVKGDTLTVRWTAGGEKGELAAKNPNPLVAKKDDKKDDKKPAAGAPEKIHLSGLLNDKGLPAESGTATQLAVVHVVGTKSRAEILKVTKDTKFVVVDGDEKKTYDQKTVIADAAVRVMFREREVTLERDGNAAAVVTVTAPKDKK